MNLLTRNSKKQAYIPLSVSFCNKILKDKRYKSKDNQYTLIVKPDGFVITNKDGSYSFKVYLDEPIDLQILTLMYYRFSKSILLNHCKFTEEQINSVIPSIFKGEYNLFQIILSSCTSGMYSSKKIYNQVNEILEDICNAIKISDVTTKYSITKDELKSIMTFFGIELGKKNNLLKDIKKVKNDEMDSIEKILSLDIPQNILIRDKRSNLSITDYENILGVTHFLNYPLILKSIKNEEFRNKVELSETEKALCEIYRFLYSNFDYSSDFYPFEDRVLKEYYKILGYRVVDVLKVIKPDYVVRPVIDYIYRVYEKGYKTPHPSISFIANLDFLECIFRVLYPKVKKAPTKYFFWMDNYDIQYYVEKLGLGKSKTKAVKSIIEISKMDILPYIKSAEKFKEVLYHDDFWTSFKHERFKENYPIMGLKVRGIICNLTVEEAKKHSSEYKIYQNYTEEEVEKMHQVYLESGLNGLVDAFPNRTLDALKYKIEDEGWNKGDSNLISEDIVESRALELFEKYKNEFIESTKVSLVEEIKQELRVSLQDGIISEITEQERKRVCEYLEKTEREKLKGEVRSEVEKELRDVIKSEIVSSVEQDTKSHYIKKVKSVIEVSVPKTIEKVVEEFTVFDLLDKIPENIIQALLREVEKI